MKSITTMICSLAVVSGCVSTILAEEYCDVRANAIQSGQINSILDVQAMLEGSDGEIVQMPQSVRFREYALFSKLMLNVEGIPARSRLVFALSPLYAGPRVRVLPELPETASCVERAQSRAAIEKCLEDVDVWQSVSAIEPGACPLDRGLQPP